jgi:Fe-S oxidoreductase
MSVPYLAVYLASLASILVLAASLASLARKNDVSLKPARILGLAKDEARRITTLDAVFLMHVAIALGIGLSILFAVLDPFFSYAPILRSILLALTVPLIAGLVAAFVWRIQRYIQSGRVEKEILHTTDVFSRASKFIQLVLMIAIVLTTSELVLAWFPDVSIVSGGVNVARNLLIAVYYTRPSVNLLRNFDRPLPTVRVPFLLGDVMDGKVDASEIKVGAGRLSEFEGFEKLSYNSCIEIGVCESACPATAAGRPLSPRVLVRKAALLQKESGEMAEPMTSITEDELWSCTSCGACVASCPVAVKHVDIIYDLRRNLVSTGRLDKEKSTLLQNLSQSQNPYGLSSKTRADWAKERGVDTLSENPKAEYLYWVGCISSFDQRAQRVAESLVKILKSAGVSFAILGNEELCTGDPARRLGEEGRYQELAYQNIERMNGYGVKKVITACPHCFNAIKNEYPVFGGKYEVLHHTQVISELIRQNRLKISVEKLRQVSLTLHDACYASRYNNVFDEPREVLGATSAEMHEMHRNREKTFCCGAGGSGYWYKVPEQRSIAGIRTEEAAQTGASMIATECPFCLSMFEDSTKVSGAKMIVRDIAEIVADGLVEPDEILQTEKKID